MKYDRVGLRDYVEMLALYKETETNVFAALKVTMLWPVLTKLDLVRRTRVLQVEKGE